MTPTPRATGKHSVWPDPPHFRAGTAMPFPLQREEPPSVGGRRRGGLAGWLRAPFPHAETAPPHCRTASGTGLLGKHWPWKQTPQVGLLTPRPGAVWEGPWHFQKPSVFAGQQMVALSVVQSGSKRREYLEHEQSHYLNSVEQNGFFGNQARETPTQS